MKGKLVAALSIIPLAIGCGGPSDSGNSLEERVIKTDTYSTEEETPSFRVRIAKSDDPAEKSILFFESAEFCLKSSPHDEDHLYRLYTAIKSHLDSSRHWANEAGIEFDEERYKEIMHEIGPTLYDIHLERARFFAGYGDTRDMFGALYWAENYIEFSDKDSFKQQEAEIKRIGYEKGFYSILNEIRRYPGRDVDIRDSIVHSAIDNYRNATELGVKIDMKSEFEKLHADIGKGNFDAKKYLAIARD